MSLQAANLYANVSVAGADKSVRDLGRVSGATDQAMKKFSIMGRSSQGIGKGVGQMAGGIAKIVERTAAIVVGAGVAATVVAANFQDAFAGVKKTVEGTPEQLDRLDEALKRLSTRIPVSYQDLAMIAQEAGALDVAAADVDKFTEAVARTVAATVGLDAATASEAFGKLGTIFGLRGKGYEQLGSALVELGRNAASTEVDIIAVTQRFAAAGTAAGLSAADVLGWSSAIASLGPEAEAAGSAMSRVFNKMTQNIALKGEKGLIGDNARARLKEFAKVTEMSVKDFTKLYKDDAGGALDLFLEKLGKMDKFAASAALKKAGIINVRDINAILLLAQHTDILNKNLTTSNKAWNENAALMEVSAKRFDTLKAKGKELWNTLLVGASSFGEGVLPAIGRVADRAKALILGHLDDLKRMGIEVGHFIDGIDWSRVEGGLKTMADLAGTILGFVKQIAGTFPEVTAGFVGLVGIDKLSGGMLGKGAGNIAGGLVNQWLARGSSAANPLWVTSAGGLGGGPGGVGGGKGGSILGAVGKVFIIGAAIGAFAELKGILDDQSAANRTAITSLDDQTRRFANAASGPAIATSLNGLLKYQRELNQSLSPEGLAYQFNIDGVGDMLRREIRSLTEAVKDADSTPGGRPGAPGMVGAKGGKIADDLDSVKVALKTAAQDLYRREWKIRGLDLQHLKPATSITPRLQFLAGAHKATDLTTVADALVTHFERSSAPLYRSSKNQERTLTSLRALQARFLAQGDRKSAAAIGADIERLERHMAGGLSKVERKARDTQLAALATKQAVRDKDLSANVRVHSTINLNGRTIATAIAAYTPSQQRHDRNV